MIRCPKTGVYFKPPCKVTECDRHQNLEEMQAAKKKYEEEQMLVCTFCDWMIRRDKVEETDISKIKCHYCLRTDMVPKKEAK